MRGERPTDAAAIVLIAERLQRARLDLGRRMTFLEREQATGVKDDVGIGRA